MKYNISNPQGSGQSSVDQEVGARSSKRFI